MIEVNVDHQLNAVQRRLGNRTIEAGHAHVVVIAQSYPTNADDLWDAVTNVDRIPRWLLPISGDATLGGRYQLQGQAGGTVLTCDPPTNFTATWEWAGNVSWIDVTVTSEGSDQARLTIEHIVDGDDENWRNFGPGALGIGWDSMVLGLALHLGTGEPIDPSFGDRWIGTPEGRRFLTGSGEAWYRVDVANGADADVARALADRCRTAYLGQSSD